MSKARGLADLGNAFDDGALSNRNLIINGAMQVAQRGTSVTGQTSSAYHTVDRWETSGSGSTYNQSQQAVPLGDSTVGSFQYFLRHEVTTGDDFSGLVYKVEDVRSVPEGTVTLSFYAKGTNPGNGQISMTARQDFGTGGSPSSDVIATTQAFTLTSNWQRFEFQITVPSLTGKTIGTNNDSFYKFQLTQPSSDDTSNAWTLDITGVQLEVGDTATPFEHRSYGDELARCQRYYQQVLKANTAFAIGVNYTSTQVHWIVDLPVEMRVQPSAIIASGSNYYVYYVNSGGKNFDDFTFETGSSTNRRVEFYDPSNPTGTAGQAGMVRGINVNAKVELDAEL
jgi:hypothetical protein